METSGISHIAICVRDIDKSLRFYRDILGMRVSFEATQDMVQRFGETQKHLYEKHRPSRRIVHLRWGAGDSKPFLVMTTHPGETVEGVPIKLDHLGLSHLSFSVPDPTALARELEAKGVQLAGTVAGYSNAQGRIRTFYVYDPDGILVQFDDGSAGG